MINRTPPQPLCRLTSAQTPTIATAQPAVALPQPDEPSSLHDDFMLNINKYNRHLELDSTQRKKKEKYFQSTSICSLYIRKSDFLVCLNAKPHGEWWRWSLFLNIFTILSLNFFYFLSFKFKIFSFWIWSSSEHSDPRHQHQHNNSRIE